MKRVIQINFKSFHLEISKELLMEDSYKPEGY